MKKIDYYYCEICNEKFNSEADAKEHEELHSVCRCQGGLCPEESTIYAGLGYGKSEGIYVDFKLPAIVRSYSDTGSSRVVRRKDTLSIKYCPFCGRDLTNEKF